MKKINLDDLKKLEKKGEEMKEENVQNNELEERINKANEFYSEFKDISIDNSKTVEELSNEIVNSFTKEVKDIVKPVMDYSKVFLDENITHFAVKVNKEDVKAYVEKTLPIRGELFFKGYDVNSFIREVSTMDTKNSIFNFFPSSIEMLNRGDGVSSILIFKTDISEITEKSGLSTNPTNYVEEAMANSPEEAFKIENSEKIFGGNTNKYFMVDSKNRQVHFYTNTLCIILGTLGIDLDMVKQNKKGVSIGEKGNFFHVYFIQK